MPIGKGIPFMFFCKHLKTVISVLLLCFCLLPLLTGCGETGAPSGSTGNTAPVPDTSAVSAGDTDDKTVSPDISHGETMGEHLRAAFLDEIAKNPAVSPETLARSLLDSPAVDFSGDAFAVQPGFLSGFSSELDGFSEGACFCPIIGSIPFVGYVFRLEDEAEAEAFLSQLREKADPRWNICTEAEELVTEQYGDTVFFVMCPGD